MTRGLSFFIICCGLVAGDGALAEAPSSVFVEELTTTELAALVRSGATTMIIPIGGTEQNGPHMALGKHNVRVKALSERIARALGNAVVAPVIAYVPEGNIDPPTEHMRFAGTITVPEEAFDKILEYAARSFKAHGFRDIVFLADHGGTQRLDKVVADRLNRGWAATDVRAHAIEEYYRASAAGFAQMLAKRGYSEAEIGTHAGLADTSLMLAIDPHLVRPDRLRADAAAGGRDGVSGDPARSSVELGQSGIDAIVAQTVVAIRAATARPAAHH